MDLPDPSRITEIGIDTETYDPGLTSLGPGFVYGLAKVVGISIYVPGFCKYFPLRHKTGNIETWPALKRWLIEVLGNPRVTAIFANSRYDLEALWSLGIEVKAWTVDVQVVESLIDEEKRSYSLASLSRDHGLKVKTRDVIETKLIERGYTLRNGKADWSKLWLLHPSEVAEYAEDDAKLTYEVFQCQKPIIETEELRDVFELECQLTPVLFDMRIRGIPVDLAKAEAENARLSDEGAVMLAAIRAGTNPHFNPFSPVQLAALAREIYGPDFVLPKTEKGNDSVSNDFLLQSGDEFLVRIGQYRQQEKIRRDFIEGVVLEGSHKGRVHPQWFQTRGSSYMSGDDVGGTRSGRIACQNPNLAQIPSRHPVLGKLVRSLFVAEMGARWFKGDLSQQEPRIALHYAWTIATTTNSEEVRRKMRGAEEARQVYLDNPMSDFHNIVMDMVNKIRAQPINRGQAKTIGLGRMYGMGKGKMADRLAMSIHKAKELISDYDRGFPWIGGLLEYCMEVADERGFVKTILGRRRHFDLWEPPSFRRGCFPIKGKDAAIKAYGSVRRAHLHKAMNSVVQGSAAEQMKKSLVALHSERIPLLITLYDEIGASLVSEEQARLIKEVTENAISFSVPHHMEYKLMESWGG